MAKRRLPMRQLRQILKLKYHTGLTHREIAKACSIGAGTVSTYVARAREAGLTWPLPPELDDATGADDQATADQDDEQQKSDAGD